MVPCYWLTKPQWILLGGRILMQVCLAPMSMCLPLCVAGGSRQVLFVQQAEVLICICLTWSISMSQGFFKRKLGHLQHMHKFYFAQFYLINVNDMSLICQVFMVFRRTFYNPRKIWKMLECFSFYGNISATDWGELTFAYRNVRIDINHFIFAWKAVQFGIANSELFLTVLKLCQSVI